MTMLLAAMIVNDGVVIFTPVNDNTQINATFVAINEITESSKPSNLAAKEPKKVDLDDDFEKQLEAIEISDKLSALPESPTLDSIFETERND